MKLDHMTIASDALEAAVHVICAETETDVLDTIKRKQSDATTIASKYLADRMHDWLNEAIRLNEPEAEMDKLCDFSQLAPHLRERYLYVARKLIETFWGSK